MTPSRSTLTPSRSTCQNATPAFSPIASPAHFGVQQMGPVGQLHPPAAVSVIAPGGGTGINGAVYAEVGQERDFLIDVVGRSRAPYDVYPEYWPNGSPGPNLATFADEVMRQGWVERSDCFVFGSRGGQVVLPILWERKGDQMPPVVCINGGCAMGLPLPVHWPASAVTFLLVGGEDYFRGDASVDEYIAETRARVPRCNSSTAILYVNEMQHMPQAALLRVVLPFMLRAILSWKARGVPPREELRHILSAVNRDGWSGRLMYTQGPGEWAPDVDFGPFHVAQHVPSGASPVANQLAAHEGMPIEVSRGEELKALFRAAACAAQPGGGAPLSARGARFNAAVHAAMAAQAQPPPPPPQPISQPPPRLPGEVPRKSKLSLPIPSAGAGGGRSLAMGNSSTPGANSPCHGALTPSRRAPSRTGGRSPCDPTPISRALGMPAHFPSPSHSHASSASPSHFAELSPAHHSPMVLVRN